ncbi:MAG: hypothetical protein ACLFTK_12505 [Anaerolineales bacterium]
MLADMRINPAWNRCRIHSENLAGEKEDVVVEFFIDDHLQTLTGGEMSFDDLEAFEKRLLDDGWIKRNDYHYVDSWSATYRRVVTE